MHFLFWVFIYGVNVIIYMYRLICKYFTHIAALRTVIEDVTYYVMRRIFNSNLQYFSASCTLKYDEQCSVIDWL